MAEFVCKVADTSGRVFSQVEAAQSVVEARQKLSDRGLYVYSVEARGGLLRATLWRAARDRAVKDADFLVFNQQFNTLIKAGLPILEGAGSACRTRRHARHCAPCSRRCADRVREGASLSEALEQQGGFPKVYVTAVLAGEKSGNLPGVLDYYIAYQRVSTSASEKADCHADLSDHSGHGGQHAIVTYLVTYVVPQFAKLYADMSVQLPARHPAVADADGDLSRLFWRGGWRCSSWVLLLVLLWSRIRAGGSRSIGSS